MSDNCIHEDFAEQFFLHTFQELVCSPEFQGVIRKKKDTILSEIKDAEEVFGWSTKLELFVRSIGV